MVRCINIAPPDQIEIPLPTDRVCLVTDDGSPLTASVAAMLKQMGWKNIVVLQYPESSPLSRSELPGEYQKEIFERFEERSIIETLQKIRKRSGPIGGFIHLHPSFQDSSLFDFPSMEREIIKQVFFIMKHLRDDLINVPDTQRSFFIAATRINGNLGFGKAEVNASFAGGLFGLLKTVNIEWPTVFCRAVDFAPGWNPEAAAKHLQQELFDANRRITEVGYTSSGRHTLSADIENLEESGTADVDRSSVFLVAGGAKGVTASCVMELARRHQCKFILVGRSELMKREPDWAEGCTDDQQLKKNCMEAFIAEGEKPTPVKIAKRMQPVLASREIRNTLDVLKQAGSEAAYISADILDTDSLRNKLASVTQTTGDITGIIHGAGVLADKLLADKTPEDFDAVIATKITGLAALVKSVPPEQLTHLILFSSAAGFYGNEAQSDYASANEILNKYAHRFKQAYPACHVISFNWGPWDGGMVTPQLKRLFEQRNIRVIPVDVGSNLLVDELIEEKRDTSQVVIGSSMVIPDRLEGDLRSYKVEREMKLEANPFLNDHVIGQEPVLPIICAVSWMADCCEGLFPGHFFQSCENASVLKGIVFTPTAPTRYQLDVTEILKSDHTGLKFEVKISSENEKRKRVFHYQAVINLVKKRTIPGLFKEFNLASTALKEGSEFYGNGTLFHGPRFQVVKKQLNIDKQQLTLECAAPALSDQEMGQFATGSFNPFADDAQLQALLIWARQFHGAGSLPLKISNAEFHTTIPFESPFFVSLKVKSTTSTRLIADVFAHTSDGQLLSHLEDAEVTISKALNEKFIK